MVLTPSQALDLIGGGLDDQTLGPLFGRSALVVRTDDTPDLDVLASLVTTVPCVTIGVAPDGPPDREAPALDVLVTDRPQAPRPWVGLDGDLATGINHLRQAIDAAPQAAVVLCQVLRIGATLDIDHALAVESLAYSTLQSGPRFRSWVSDRPNRPHAGAREPALLCERSADVLTVTLNRPDVHNAVDTGLREELVDALRLAVADPSIVRVVLRGAGPSFCSGGDLTEFGTLPDPATAHIVRSTRSPAQWMARVAARTTAQVHGTCVGAGVELAAFADRVVATADATFRLPEVAMGLIPGAGGTVSVPRRMGRSRAAYFALSNSALTARRALQWGLVDELRDG